MELGKMLPPVPPRSLPPLPHPLAQVPVGDPTAWAVGIIIHRGPWPSESSRIATKLSRGPSRPDLV